MGDEGHKTLLERFEDIYRLLEKAKLDFDYKKISELLIKGRLKNDDVLEILKKTRGNLKQAYRYLKIRKNHRLIKKWRTLSIHNDKYKVFEGWVTSLLADIVEVKKVINRVGIAITIFKKHSEKISEGEDTTKWLKEWYTEIQVSLKGIFTTEHVKRINGLMIIGKQIIDILNEVPKFEECYFDVVTGKGDFEVCDNKERAEFWNKHKKLIRGTHGRPYFESVVFNSDVSDFNLDYCTFVNCKFLKGVVLSNHISNDLFEGCTFKSLHYRSITFDYTRLLNCWFENISIISLKFIECHIEDVNFINLTRCSLFFDNFDNGFTLGKVHIKDCGLNSLCFGGNFEEVYIDNTPRDWNSYEKKIDYLEIKWGIGDTFHIYETKIGEFYIKKPKIKSFQMEECDVESFSCSGQRHFRNHVNYLTGALFKEVRMKEAKFKWTILDGSRIITSKKVNIIYNVCRLRNATLKYPFSKENKFIDCDLENATIKHTSPAEKKPNLFMEGKTNLYNTKIINFFLNSTRGVFRGIKYENPHFIKCWIYTVEKDSFSRCHFVNTEFYGGVYGDFEGCTFDEGCTFWLMFGEKTKFMSCKFSRDTTFGKSRDKFKGKHIPEGLPPWLKDKLMKLSPPEEVQQAA